MTDVLLEGFHAVKHALRFAPDLVTSVTAQSLTGAHALCQDLAPDLVELFTARTVLGAVDHPTGVSGTALRPEPDRSCLRARHAPLVVLDQPRHAGNAGAVIRVAAAASASGVGFVGDFDPWHQSVLRGSAGLHFALPVLTCSVTDLVGTVLALDGDGEELGQIPDDAILVVGSERRGLSAAVRERADRVVALPMRDGVSSLNLATAVSAALYAWRLAPR